MDLYNHLAGYVDLVPTPASPEPQSSSLGSEEGSDTITKVVETGDEGRAGLLLGHIAP